MHYQCTMYNSEKSVRWPAQIRLVSRNRYRIEVEIQGRDSCFQVIIGNGTFGNYLCIPSLDIGCALAQSTDFYWNTERLAKHLNIVDTTTITTGLQYLNQL